MATDVRVCKYDTLTQGWHTFITVSLISYSADYQSHVRINTHTETISVLFDYYYFIFTVLWFFFSRTDLAIDVPEFLDLNRLRATGLQPGEEELPDLMPPIVLPEDTRGTDTQMSKCSSPVCKVHSLIWASVFCEKSLAWFQFESDLVRFIPSTFGLWVCVATS